MLSTSVVFVHGFTGSPYNTWRHRDADDDQEPPYKSRKIGSGFRSRRQPVFWPRDLLPTTLPGARILTYGYDTHLTLKYIGNLGREITLYDIARDLLLSLERCRRHDPSRPILFISHSLGGLVVKDMLRYADHNKGDTSSHLRDLVLSTVGLVFFGTPHLGADPRSLVHKGVEGIARLVLRVNDNIVRTLRPNSENARRLQDEFVPLVQRQKWAVHSFQEACGNRVLGKQVSVASPLPRNEAVCSYRSRLWTICPLAWAWGRHSKRGKISIETTAACVASQGLVTRSMER